ncbi:MFS transporter [Lactobacillus sp. DCY120]|uniref:MFS transporter n=1 Tax=Bombilactobacillus apium TaxID=2675299 RepID=A0A850R0L6_9LACO|nr:phosphoglycerate transporter protein PgtP [Bombilactobacillus apium]NVY96609.1 MFS transporter [Bombilactobacillus apium]
MNFLRPPKASKTLAAEQIDPTYRRLRGQVFVGIFIGYAGYYLLRNNFSIAMPQLMQAGFTKTQLGSVFAAVSIAYGFSKFVMGTVSDRSNARIFLPLGLVLTAVINLVFGLIPQVSQSLSLMFCLLFLIGWCQGMGWPPSGRVLTHWFSLSERGSWTSLWNVAHNVGGALMAPLATGGVAFVAWAGWQLPSFTGAFLIPALIGIVLAVVAWLLIRDTPESMGLPPIEVYKDDYPSQDHHLYEEELSTKEILGHYVLNNKWVWLIACANIFVYFVRYGVENWAPAYLTEVQHISLAASSNSYFLYEIAGIPGTIFAGWVSDKIFHGRRGPAGVVFMLVVSVFVLLYWQAHSLILINFYLIMIGFLIYGPVMLIGLQALDSVPKKAAGTAAGLTGLFGYLFGSVAANAIMGLIVDHWGWGVGFWTIFAASLLAAGIFASTWNLRGQETVSN